MSEAVERSSSLDEAYRHEGIQGWVTES
ncbi:uncharacterized protein METZ01_LOCUS74328 [marine metagenome]|uniref:Uncharacterized protein n=1 Tax=marine metagenome TaxID=408172 RepID=A0A381U080_9ZZZZ